MPDYLVPAQLIIPVGIPGCGKSSFGERFFAGDVIVSSDGIREEMGDVYDQSRNNRVFDEFHRRIEEALQEGRRVYADATNLTADSRKKVRVIGRLHHAEVHLIYFANPDQAVMRNQRRERVVPEEAMQRMLDKYENFRLVLPQEAHLYNSVTEIRRVG